MLVPFVFHVVEPPPYWVDQTIKAMPTPHSQVMIVPDRDNHDCPKQVVAQLEYMFNPPQITEQANWLVAHVGTEEIFNHYYPDEKWDGSDFVLFTSYLSDRHRNELVDYIKLLAGYKFDIGYLPE